MPRCPLSVLSGVALALPQAGARGVVGSQGRGLPQPCLALQAWINSEELSARSTMSLSKSNRRKTIRTQRYIPIRKVPESRAQD